MKVLALSSYGGLGGAELALVSYLEHRPAGVVVTAGLVEDGPLAQRLVGIGVPTWSASGYDGRPGPAAMARFTRLLLGRLRRDRPDVVWATGLKAATLAVPACRLLRIPLVWHKVDFSLDAKIAKPLGAAVHAVIGVSDAVTEPLGRWRASRVVGVVGPPVRLPEDLEVVPADAPPAIGMLATLVPIKGHEHVLRAAAILSEARPELRVLFAGGASPDYPDQPARLRRLAEELGLADRVELLGRTDDVAGVLGRLSVYVSATYRDPDGFGWEGLGLSVLEASWAGLPVVATRAGGTAEAVRDGETGTLLGDPPDPAAIAAAVAAYLDDPSLARRTGRAGRAFARAHYAPAPLAERLFAALEAAAGGGT